MHLFGSPKSGARITVEVYFPTTKALNKKKKGENQRGKTKGVKKREKDMGTQWNGGENRKINKWEEGEEERMWKR